MPLIIMVISALMNVMRTVPTAATAVTGAAAGGVVLFERPPETPMDWVIVIAGAVGMIANVIHANATAVRSSS